MSDVRSLTSQEWIPTALYNCNTEELKEVNSGCCAAPRPHHQHWKLLSYFSVNETLRPEHCACRSRRFWQGRKQMENVVRVPQESVRELEHGAPRITTTYSYEASQHRTRMKRRLMYMTTGSNTYAATLQYSPDCAGIIRADADTHG